MIDHHYAALIQRKDVNAVSLLNNNTAYTMTSQPTGYIQASSLPQATVSDFGRSIHPEPGVTLNTKKLVYAFGSDNSQVIEDMSASVENLIADFIPDAHKDLPVAIAKEVTSYLLNELRTMLFSKEEPATEGTFDETMQAASKLLSATLSRQLSASPTEIFVHPTWAAQVMPRLRFDQFAKDKEDSNVNSI